jgi:prepilin-type N-terminal cleavage/methylation domain-containing protein
MKAQHSGFTLVEVAIVLVIIGLLLGGILKGQELINGARVKNLASDFRNVPIYVHSYQDRFKAIPGDDTLATSHLTGTPAATLATTPAGKQGNGVLDGDWHSTSATDESRLFWQHVRMANVAPGPTDPADIQYGPKNALGGDIGVSGTTTAQLQIAGMTGTYQVCSSGVTGKLARQLDQQLDDGDTAGGAMRVVADNSALGSPALATTAIDDAAAYTVCMLF